MAFKVFFLLGLLALLSTSSLVTLAETEELNLHIGLLHRKNFPKKFLWGASASAYQFEGAAFEDGKGPSIWDNFTHEHPDRIDDGSNGDVAADQYHRYKEDVKILKNLNMDAYRLSISWPRILPKGKLSGGINQKGITYYNNLIDELLANGITPFVTLFHWDLPQTLEDEYNGFLSPRIIPDFRDYAELCFKEFGDRVKFWSTFNEPYIFSLVGYALGMSAPGRCSKSVNPKCQAGNSGTEPYLVNHHQLLAHAAAVQVYRKKYQASQKGKMGMTLVANWFVPFSNSTEDKKAAQRALDFMYDCYLEPMTKGDYPKSMRTLVGNRLPRFTIEQAKQLNGAFDYIGLNYYTSTFTANAQKGSNAEPNLLTDALTNTSVQPSVKLLDPRAPSDWLDVYPKGLYDLLVYTKKKYNNPLIYIHENGAQELSTQHLSLEEELLDTFRIDFHYRHLFYVRSALRDGVNIQGYIAWSFLDVFEWTRGFTKRLGINFVDYKNGSLKRYQKLSALWFKNFLERN